jgi:hypothetical protein
MFRTILLSLITGTACFAASSQSPEGTWATQVRGHDHGVCYLTYSNNFTEAGYGITVGANGPFVMAGTWNIDKKGKLVGGFTQFVDVGSIGATFEGKATDTKLNASVKSTEGRFSLKSQPASTDYFDLSGTWTANVKEYNRQFYVDLICTPSTNLPAWFDITGKGVNGKGSYTVTGAILITPDNRCAAYTTYDYGTSTLTDTFDGKLIKNGKKIVLHGRTENKENASLRAEPVAPTN